MKKRVNAEPCEGFKNLMLDALLTRMRFKHQDAETLNVVMENVATALARVDHGEQSEAKPMGRTRSNSETSLGEDHESLLSDSEVSGSDEGTDLTQSSGMPLTSHDSLSPKRNHIVSFRRDRRDVASSP